MKKIPHLFRLVGACALLALSAGCAQVLTKEPFGEAAPPGENDTELVGGLWYSPSLKDKHRMVLSVAFRKQPAGTAEAELIIRTKDGEQAYEARLHKVKTGEKQSPEAIVFFRPKGGEKPWRFLWFGMAANADEKTLPVLLLFAPDAEAFEKLAVGIDKEFSTKGYDILSDEKAMLLTDSPEKILAALQGKDLRTFMISTMPFVFLRRPPEESPVPASPASEAATAAPGKDSERRAH